MGAHVPETRTSTGRRSPHVQMGWWLQGHALTGACMHHGSFLCAAMYGLRCSVPFALPCPACAIMRAAGGRRKEGGCTPHSLMTTCSAAPQKRGAPAAVRRLVALGETTQSVRSTPTPQLAGRGTAGKNVW
uniref:Uncharacterized protein n=1 Tax=Chlamydomonas euryale TaxID=1486919 RepID=A0A7R9V7V9_9CHLO|mmetsp:Transcript_248/g.628  ORF Transcript_248/g.628 Transcript_248/m.628 type:complete len:131 (+) Transcript_248:250-642(+)|eukprot:362968-Chlamydomonas_euryale.AAC.3